MLGMLNRRVPDWDQFPPKFWQKVFGLLDPVSLNSVHLVSRKFHSLANDIGHPLNLSRLSEDQDISKRFQESNRTYKEIHGYNYCGYLQNTIFDLIEKLEVQGKFVRKLTINTKNLTEKQVYGILKLLPNLMNLDLEASPNRPITDEVSEFSELTMLKLQRLFVRDLAGNLSNIIISLKCPVITEIHHEVKTGYLMPFVASHLGTLKKLSLIIVDYRGDFTARLQDLGTTRRFETLELKGLRIYPTALARFFRFQSKLKELKLREIELTNEVLSAVFNSCPNLEVLELGGPVESNSSLRGIHKLRQLKHLVIEKYGRHADYRILRSLTLQVNPNLTDLKVEHLVGITKDFLVELSNYNPNLKKLKFKESNSHEMKIIRTVFIMNRKY
jgi:hypothetical protein